MNTNPHDPQGFLEGLGTLPPTETSVSSPPSCLVVLANTEPEC